MTTEPRGRSTAVVPEEGRPGVSAPSPSVSAITIFLDAERFMGEAIESVFAQTYEDWELLLVDDGSTDGSTALALEYARQWPMKVRYLQHDGHRNRGMSASRNLGIHHARGKHITFLDADDVWLPNKLEDQVAILSSRPDVAMVYGSLQHWYSWTGRVRDRARDITPHLGVRSGTVFDPPTLLARILSGNALVPGICSLLLRRDALERIGGFEESFTGMYEDQVFLAKALLSERVMAVTEAWERYRRHGDSCTGAAKRDQHRLARQRFLAWLDTYLLERGVEDGEVWKALHTAQWRDRHPAFARVSRSFRRWRRRLGGSRP